MELREDKYLAGEYEGKLFIKIVGNATMKNSKTLDLLFENVFKSEKKDIILNLEECNYMDSTMLGLLAKTAIKLKKLWDKKMYAMNIPNTVCMSFKSTGVDKLMELIENSSSEKVEVEQLETRDFDGKSEKTMHILDSHRVLMELNDENKVVFKNVVNLLEQELKK
jgi:anti-anti-sigma factor